MSSGDVNLVIDQGAVFKKKILWQNAIGVDQDLWDATNEIPTYILRMYIRRNYSTAPAVRLTIGRGNVWFYPQRGYIQLDIPATETDDLDFRSAVWDLEAVPVLSDEVTVVDRGSEYKDVSSVNTTLTFDFTGYSNSNISDWTAGDIIYALDDTDGETATHPDTGTGLDVGNGAKDDNNLYFEVSSVDGDVVEMRRSFPTAYSVGKDYKFTRLALDEDNVRRLLSGRIAIKRESTHDRSV